MPHEPLSPALRAGPSPAWKPASLSELFGIDLRSLAAFRVGLGLLLLWDLYGRARTLRMHYTGEGALPRELAAVAGPDMRLFHVFLWSDRFAVQAALFAVFAVLALLLVLGYRARLVSVLTFVFLGSLVRRNVYACHTGDTWLEALSFWAMFLPLGAHFSIDRLRGRQPPPPAGSVASLAGAGALLQILIFYVSAGYLKSRYDVWLRGDAVWTFTHTLEYTRPFGQWLGQFPGVCRFLTFATLVLEGLAPFLLFFPFGTRALRGVLFLVFAGFHLTLQATIHIGIFQIICIVAMTLFLPGSAWDFLARHAPNGIPARWSSLRDAVRARFGREPARDTPAAGGWRRAASLGAQVSLVPALALVLVSNVNTATRDPYDKGDRGVLPLPTWIDGYGRQLNLVQNWNMFSDIERLFLGWFLVIGQQEDGQMVDVLARRPFAELVRPEHYARFFPNHNSRRYWRNVASGDLAFLRNPLCEYLAREWERSGALPLTNMAIAHVGRVPSNSNQEDQVKWLVGWGRSLPEDATPELQQRRAEGSVRWKGFLGGLPQTVPANGE